MEQIKTISKIRFAPYRYRFVTESGEQHEITLIAITYNDIVIRLTDYHKYVGPKKNSGHIYKNREDEVRRVCNFLTYVLFEKKHKYKANTVMEIKFEAVEDYLMEYARVKNRFDQYVSKQSAEKERCAVCMFMSNIHKNTPDIEGHYYARKVIAEDKQKQVNISRKSKAVWEYEIEAVSMGENSYDLIRDIPDEALKILLRNIKLYEPELYFAVILQLASGIREGEVVNVRRFDSKYFGGIKKKTEFGKLIFFEIDLEKEYQLRSDGISTGKIKKERKQKVYPPFLEIVQEAYETHLKLITKDMVEEEGPMFVNDYKNKKTGKRMALTVRSYTNRIKKVFYEHALPEMLKTTDIEVRTFAKLVNENSFGLHAFRHWFTVQLLLNEEDLTGIAFWRGDSSLQSAHSYLMNKGEIMKRYVKANNIVAEKISKEITKGVFDGL